MLFAAEEHIKNLNPRARVNLYGQELNAESYAICRSDMLDGRFGAGLPRINDGSFLFLQHMMSKCGP